MSERVSCGSSPAAKFLALATILAVAIGVAPGLENQHSSKPADKARRATLRADDPTIVPCRWPGPQCYAEIPSVIPQKKRTKSMGVLGSIVYAENT
jgi:hypothetical protein